MARRAHLAVLAHIRHTHTQYDYLLKLMPYTDARKRVEGPTLDVLISWRDDVDDDTNVMRDVLREVIIISDNEDDEEAEFVNGQSLTSHRQHSRDISVEIISANNNVRIQQLDLAVEPPEPENERPIQYIPRQNPIGSQRPNDRLREERRGAQRHRRWEQALSRKRNDPPPSPSPTRFVQPISEPVYRNPIQNDSLLRPRGSQMPLPSPARSAHESQRDLQSDMSQHHLLLQRVDHLPSDAIDSSRKTPFHSTNPMHQVSFL